MKLDHDLMLRLHRGESTAAEVFAEQSRRDDGPAAPTPPTCTLPAYLPGTAGNTRGWRRVVSYLASRGVAVTPVDRRGVGNAWRGSKAMVTWGVRWHTDHLTRGGRKVLFLENGLLGQKQGMYVDDGGYFSDSAIVTDTAPPSHDEVAAMQRLAGRVTGRPWYCGGNPAGPVLVALQVHGDCSVRYDRYFPGRAGRNPNDALISEVASAIPAGTPVVVRPHPRERDGWSGSIPDGWRVETGGTAAEALSRSRALVCITSTIVSEALAMGVPVCCIGRSAWIGRGCVIEAADARERIPDVLTQPPDEWASICYLCSVMRHQISYDGSTDPATIPPLVRYVNALTGTAPPAPPAWEDAARYVAAHGTDADRAIAAAWEAKARECRTCYRARMRRRLIELAAEIKKRSAAQPSGPVATPEAQG